MVNTYKQKQIILSSIPFFVLLSILITLYLQDISEFNSYSLSIKNLLVVCWALNFYRITFKELAVVQLDREPMFWVSTGLIFYSLGSFFIFGLMNHLLQQSHELATAFYYVTLFLGYLLYLTFLIAFLLKKEVNCQS